MRSHTNRFVFSHLQACVQNNNGFEKFWGLKILPTAQREKPVPNQVWLNQVAQLVRSLSGRVPTCLLTPFAHKCQTCARRLFALRALFLTYSWSVHVLLYQQRLTPTCMKFQTSPIMVPAQISYAQHNHMWQVTQSCLSNRSRGWNRIMPPKGPVGNRDLPSPEHLSIVPSVAMAYPGAISRRAWHKTNWVAYTEKQVCQTMTIFKKPHAHCTGCEQQLTNNMSFRYINPLLSFEVITTFMKTRRPTACSRLPSFQAWHSRLQHTRDSARLAEAQWTTRTKIGFLKSVQRELAPAGSRKLTCKRPSRTHFFSHWRAHSQILVRESGIPLVLEGTAFSKGPIADACHWVEDFACVRELPPRKARLQCWSLSWGILPCLRHMQFEWQLHPLLLLLWIPQHPGILPPHL